MQPVLFFLKLIIKSTFAKSKLFDEKILLAFFCLTTLALKAQTLYSTIPLKGNEPEWIQLMFQANADPGIVSEKFKSYFKTHPFEKIITHNITSTG